MFSATWRPNRSSCPSHYFATRPAASKKPATKFEDGLRLALEMLEGKHRHSYMSWPSHTISTSHIRI